MSLARSLTIPVVLSLAVGPVSGPAVAAVVERFRADPLLGFGPNVFLVEGDAEARFRYVPSERPRFAGDPRGSFRVLYDTTRPAARIATPLGEVVSLSEDFEFGAVLTIRSNGFHATPDGFSQIAFGLWNSRTTGINRTAFPADSFDLVEFDYFANVGEFGGPFLSPTVFGGSAGDNAFLNFAFQSAELSLPFDVPLLCLLRYSAAERTLALQVSRHSRGSTFVPLPESRVSVDLSALDPTFLVDSLGIAAYFEGFESLRAQVDFDLLFFQELPEPLRSVGP
ncbi:MAG: hypothetical protein ACE5JH_01130 [Acidobacteriota bacterium]